MLIERIIDSHLLLFEPHLGEGCVLNAVGAEIYNMLRQGFSLEDVTNNVGRKYRQHVDDAREAVIDFVNELREIKLWPLDGPPDFRETHWGFEEFCSERLIPYIVHIELLDYCNYRCPHCYISFSGHNLLDYVSPQRLVNEIAQVGTFLVVLSGGEPFLLKSLLDLIFSFREQGIGVGIFTNGSKIPFLSDREMQVIANNVAFIQISLHRSQALDMDAFTGYPGSWSLVQQSVKRCREYSIPCDVAIPITVYNYQEINQLRLLVESWGGTADFGYPLSPSRKEGLAPVSLNPPSTAWPIILQAVESREKQNQISESDRDGRICSAGWTRLAIAADATVFPCVEWPVSVGNLQHQSLPDIWFASDKLQQIRELKLRDTQCVSCPLLEWCDVCPGYNYLYNKDFRKGRGTPLCDVARSRFISTVERR